MRSLLTRYTMRSDIVRRRDQAFGPKYFRGSGAPSPANGSRSTASTMSRARSATRRFVSVQKRRSSRNCDATMASRAAPWPRAVPLHVRQAEIRAELRRGQPKAAAAVQLCRCGLETCGVGRRP